MIDRLRRRGRRLLRVLAFAMGTLVSVGAASAAEIIVILDGSGSSAGQIGGVPKIDIARAALGTVLIDAPADLSIGLVAYGHRQDEACNDVELVAEPGPVDAFLDAAAGVRSLGRSPIAEATETAAAALAGADDATIILITDNADNCAPDPCEMVAAIAGAQPDLTISVLGIAVPDNEVADIACFAELTGGVFLQAENAAAFGANLDQVVRAAWGPPPPPPPTATIAFPFDVVQGREFAIEFTGPAAVGDTIRISWVGSPDDAFVTAALVPESGDSVDMIAPSEVGAFELRYYHADLDTILARMPLPVAEIIPTIEVPSAAMAGAEIPVRWQVDGRGGETIEIALPGTTPGDAAVVVEAIRSANAMAVPAPTEPGTYEVRLVAPPPSADHAPAIRGNARSSVLAFTEITITEPVVTFEFSEPVTAGSELRANWAGPMATEDEIRFAASDAADDQWLAIAAAVETEATFPVPTNPGMYELRYWSAPLGAVVGRSAFEVVAGEATIAGPESAAGGATFAVSWTGPGAMRDEIVLFDGEGNAVDRVRVPLFEEPVTLDAPVIAGTYRIAYMSRDGVQLAATEIAIAAPEVTLSAVEEVDPGAALEITWSGPGGRFDEIRLVDPGNVTAPLQAMRVEASGTLSWRAPEDPGRYFVQYWSGAGRTVLESVPIDVLCPGCEDLEPLQPPELRLSP